MGKQFRKTKTKMNIPLCTAAVLLYLTVLSTCLVSGLFARYTTSAQSGDQARAAKFSITGEGSFGQTIEADLVPGENKIVKLTIKNDSEVSVEYTITAVNETENLPLTLSLEKKGSSPAEKNTEFTVQQLPNNKSTDEYILHIEWPIGKNDPDWMGMVDYITVTVTAAQID